MFLGVVLWEVRGGVGEVEDAVDDFVLEFRRFVPILLELEGARGRLEGCGGFRGQPSSRFRQRAR